MRVPDYGRVSSLRDDSLPSLPLFNGAKFDIFYIYPIHPRKTRANCYYP